MTHEDLINYVVDEDVSRVKSVLDDASIKTKVHSLEYSINLGDGMIKCIRQTIDINVNDPITDGKISGVFQDVTDLRNAERQVKTLALYDSFTGLPNRVFFKRLLTKKVLSSKRHKQQFALLDINFDNFMRINSNLGHDIGDKLILSACGRLKNTLHNYDELISTQEQEVFNSSFLAHLGGDNFIILLSDIKSADDAAVVARRINSTFSEAFNIQNNEIHVPISIGIGLYPNDAINADDLLKKASSALHNAKETGKNCYRFYTKEMNVLSFQRLAMETSLRKALEQKQFELYYQPKISLEDHRIIGAEALIRWNHPEMGLVSPAEFISLAESTGLILPILQGLKEFGCSISIDDFGTGYSSLSYLKRLPISKLKIDQSFIREIMHDNDDSIIVNAVIALAHSLGLSVIAEGVEEKDQLEYLSMHKCDAIQGYFYSRPLAAADFYQWAKKYELENLSEAPVKLVG